MTMATQLVLQQLQKQNGKIHWSMMKSMMQIGCQITVQKQKNPLLQKRKEKNP